MITFDICWMHISKIKWLVFIWQVGKRRKLSKISGQVLEVIEFSNRSTKVVNMYTTFMLLFEHPIVWWIEYHKIAKNSTSQLDGTPLHITIFRICELTVKCCVWLNRDQVKSNFMIYCLSNKQVVSTLIKTFCYWRPCQIGWHCWAGK